MELTLEREPVSRQAVPAVLALLLFAALFGTVSAFCGGLSPLWLLLPGLASVAGVLALSGRGRLQTAAVFLPLLAVGLLLPLWNSGALGLEVLYNRLCAVSEARNAYRYLRFPLSLTAEEEARYAALGTALLSLILGGLAAGGALRRGIALLLFLTVAGCEVYFGVTPGLVVTVLFGVALALCLLRGRSAALPAFLRRGAACLGFCLAVVLAVQVAAPGVNLSLENWSEWVRDQLGVLEQRSVVQMEETVQKWQETQHQDRLDEDAAGDRTEAPAETEDYERQEEQEDEISRPLATDWMRLLLIVLLILLLLVGPFVPFALLDRQKRRAALRRADFASEDCSLSVRAMFRHLMLWLEAAGLKRENRLFSACVPEIGTLMDEEYARRYQESLELWQAATYSPHPLTEEDREKVRDLLETTERVLYMRAGRLERFRLKYILCLVGAEGGSAA